MTVSDPFAPSFFTALTIAHILAYYKYTDTLWKPLEPILSLSGAAQPFKAYVNFIAASAALSASTRSTVLPQPLEPVSPPNHKESQLLAPYRSLYARKRDKGYIPRPKNAFMVYRSHFIEMQKISGNVERNHRHIS
jgi:hypothetical protein